MNEYRLPSKNAHNPDYCSWLAVCVNYSANFYCKIALINRFKLYLIKNLASKSAALVAAVFVDVTLGLRPRVTCSTSGRHVSMSHSLPSVIC